MIIFSYGEQLIGFLSPRMGSFISTLNEVREGNEENLVNKYSFGSYIFLTDNAIVKYYEKDDKTYNFVYKEDINGTTILDIESKGEKLNCTVKNNSKVDLEQDLCCKFN